MTAAHLGQTLCLLHQQLDNNSTLANHNLYDYEFLKIKSSYQRAASTRIQTFICSSSEELIIKTLYRIQWHHNYFYFHHRLFSSLHPNASMINDSLWSCHTMKPLASSAQIHVLVLEDEMGVYYMPLWARRLYTENVYVHLLGQLGNPHEVDGRSRIEWAVQHTPTLPEQSSYLTSRPQRGSACPRLGWTWHSTAPSCWWSGRCIVLQRGGGGDNPMLVLRKKVGTHNAALQAGAV